jgi:tetratricopeptide (TPR) repeat protein
MIELAPDKKEYKLEELYANTNLGTVLMDNRHYKEAAAIYQSSLNVAEALAAAEPRNASYRRQVSDTLAWLADAHENSGALDQALGERERQLGLLREIERSDPRDAQVQRDAMTAHRSIGRLLADGGDVAGGLREFQAGLAIADALFRIEPENTEWLQANASVRFDLAELQLASGQREAAAATTRSGCEIIDRLAQRNANVADWKADHRAWCLNLRARLALSSGNASQALAIARQSLAAARSSPKPFVRAIQSSRALAIGGSAEAALGNRNEAVRWWSAALSAIPSSIELRPREQSEVAAIHTRLGNRGEAQQLNSALASMGYRYPGRFV